MDILFALLWGWVLFTIQISFRISIGPLPVVFDLLTILVIYTAFGFSFVRGLIVVILLSFTAETFTFVPHGFLILANLILFAGIQLILDQILSEAYLTKSFWVALFSLAGHLLTGFVYEFEGGFAGDGFFWLRAFFQSILNGLLSFPLFIILDLTLDLWRRVFSRRRAQLTGADFYQVKSNQRKYF